jgi:hypothetical protein
MKTIIYVRHNVDWRGMTFEKFMNQPRRFGPGGHIGDNVLTWFKNHNHILGLWDEIFNLGYFEFRARAKELAETTYQNVDVIKGRDALLKECKKPGNAYIVPIDDDDWIAPHLSQVLDSKKAPLVHWTMRETVTSRNTSSFRLPPHWFRSCSFAVSKDLIRKHSRLTTLLSHHVSAGFYLKRIKARAVVKQALTVANRTVASVGRMRRRYESVKKRRRGDARENFKKAMFREAFRLSEKKTCGCDWAIPYVEENAFLHQQLIKCYPTML